MASTSTYLNFEGTTEHAFLFYKSVFGTEFTAPIQRMGNAPPMPSAPPMTDEQKNLVMHVSLPILGGHLLMGTDAVESMGHKLTVGDNFSLSLAPDSREETERLFNALAAGGEVRMPLADMFWGAYWGSLVDKFGVGWMFNFEEKKA